MKKIFAIELIKAEILTEKEMKDIIKQYLMWKGFHEGQFEVREMNVIWGIDKDSVGDDR